MYTILRKELSDHFSSTRFLILFCLVVMVSLITTYMVGSALREALEGMEKPSHVFLMLFTTRGEFFSLVEFIAFFGPLVGIVLGFDAINRERNEGTLSKILAQPIFRDAVINGKFLAGVITASIMLVSLLLLVSGLGLLTIGVVPGVEEAGRLLALRFEDDLHRFRGVHLEDRVLGGTAGGERRRGEFRRRLEQTLHRLRIGGEVLLRRREPRPSLFADQFRPVLTGANDDPVHRFRVQSGEEEILRLRRRLSAPGRTAEKNND